MLSYLTVNPSMVLKSIETYIPYNTQLLLNFVMLWLVLHYSAKINETKLELKQQIQQIEAQAHQTAQTAIIEQALIFDREVRRVQCDLTALRRQLVALRDSVLVGSDLFEESATDQSDLMQAFITAKNKGLRRMCILGRGWVPLKRVQTELGLSDQNVKSLCNK